jgi:hypothetical protein
MLLTEVLLFVTFIQAHRSIFVADELRIVFSEAKNNLFNG